MPRRPGDLTCAVCGSDMWKTGTSLPQGEATCHPCRRLTRSEQVKPCERCGVNFEPDRPTTRFCSRRCHNPARTCEVCRSEYRATYYKQRTCGRECGAKINAALVERRTGRLAQPKFSAVRWQTCRTCTVPYTSRGGRRCGHSAYSHVRSADWRQDRPCIECGSTMSLHRHNMRRLRCDGCLLLQKRRDKDKRRARERDAYVADVSRPTIYKRDGYRCKLCGKRLNMKATAPHPMSPTLDHIVPLAQGGKHEPANAQAAHFLCNSLKGDRGGNEQLLLIG